MGFPMHRKFLLTAGFVCLSSAFARDPFEIHVYEYEAPSGREYSLEAHLNVDPQGTSLRDNGQLPAHNQTHLTLEPAFGFERALHGQGPSEAGTSSRRCCCAGRSRRCSS